MTEPAPMVLIVEDEAPIAALVAMVVEEAGYTPRVARQGRQALEVARAHWPLLLITDLMLPLMSGAELIAALRTEGQAGGHPVVPVILMTAAGSRQAQAAQADEILSKPFDIADLEALIHRFLPPRDATKARGRAC